MHFLSPFKILPLHIVELILDYVADNGRLQFDNVSKGSDKYTGSLMPLLDTCTSFLSPTLTHLFGVYKMRLSISGEYQTRPYWLQTYVKDTGLPAHLYVKVLTVSVDVQDIYSGAALRVFSSEPYTTRTFPIVCSIEFSPYLPSATEQQTFIATDPPDIEFNISALVERAKHITTKLEKIGIILSSHDNEPPPPVQQLSGRSGLYNH
ncbi:hypothetical protein GGI08_006083, partial [Coemansia sp. S2]